MAIPAGTAHSRGSMTRHVDPCSDCGVGCGPSAAISDPGTLPPLRTGFQVVVSSHDGEGQAAAARMSPPSARHVAAPWSSVTREAWPRCRRTVTNPAASKLITPR
jgi:hypothetical protein